MTADAPTTMGGSGHEFPLTSWTMVLRARTTGEHLERLCRLYWKPVYVHIRRKGTRSNEDAKDLTQSFFTWLLEKGTIEGVEPGRGRFRNFLKVTLEHFLHNEHRARQAEVRGGGVKTFSISASDNPLPLAAATEDFDQLWAANLLQEAFHTLEERYRVERKEDYYRVFARYYLGDVQPTYAEMAREFRMNENEVQRALKHARAALREIVRSLVRETLEDPSEAEDEIARLFQGAV